METRASRVGFGVWSFLVICFLWIPLIVIALYAFNKATIQSWPIADWTVHWFSVAWHNSEVRSALWLSVKIALLAAAAALVLGTMASFAIHRFRFFGREGVSFLILLPIALPGVITGISLNTFYVFSGIGFSMWSIVIGHATFCVVVVYNNVLARLRRTQGSLFEAAADLGANGVQTFRDITMPLISTALVAGAMLAFALSFDEVIVTTFTAGAQNTVPIWILAQLRNGQHLPEVNVVVSFVILVTIIPVLVAARLTGGSGAARVQAGR